MKLQIQDDEIIGIEFNENYVHFIIPDKETKFSGNLSLDGHEIQGAFIFPDGSEHPLNLALEKRDISAQELRIEDGIHILTRWYTQAQLEALGYDQIHEVGPSRNGQMPVQLSFKTDRNAAILKIESFGIPDIDKYIECVDSMFVQINDHHTRNLILDLRGNNGGHPIFAAILYSYLSQEEFTYFKRNEATPKFEPFYNPMPADTNHFSGICYVLVDGGCLSTTGHLISLLKYHKRAVFIGEEPGSWFTCNDNGQLATFPNTQIEVYIPRSTFQTKVNGYQMGDPFIVDHPLHLSWIDLLKDKDVYMEYTLLLIAESSASL